MALLQRHFAKEGTFMKIHENSLWNFMKVAFPSQKAPKRAFWPGEIKFQTGLPFEALKDPKDAQSGIT